MAQWQTLGGDTVILKAAYEDNDTAAHAIDSYLRGQVLPGRELRFRPYDFHRPEFTSWWFIPGEDWPAYRYGKLFVDQYPLRPAKPQYMFVGLYTEKGLGAELAHMASVPKNDIMHEDWRWPTLLESIADDEVTPTVREVMNRCDSPLCVSLDAHEFNRVPKPGDQHAPVDWLAFSIDSADGSVQNLRDGAEVLTNLNSCSGISELARRLSEAEELEYFWLNLRLGVQLEYAKATVGAWDAEKIWHNALEPWEPWLG